MEEKLLELFQFIAEKLELNTENLNLQKLMLELKNEDEKLYHHLSEFKIAVDAWIFARKDMHLNLKAPDLFHAQKKVFKDNLASKADILYVECLKLDFDIKPYLKEFEIEF